MANTGSNSSGSNQKLKQLIGVAVILGVVVLAVATDSLVIGYVAMTLVLCAFFIAVAFDVGVTRSAQGLVELDERRKAGAAGGSGGHSAPEV